MGCASFLFTDFESSSGTETLRVWIADWRSEESPPQEEETYQNKKTKTAFKEKT
jgi:hypothetical protein